MRGESGNASSYGVTDSTHPCGDLFGRKSSTKKESEKDVIGVRILVGASHDEKSI